MKRLWKSIPPCMSDVTGFEAVMNALNGMGIIDDSSHYKPVQQGGVGGRGMGRHFDEERGFDPDRHSGEDRRHGHDRYSGEDRRHGHDRHSDEERRFGRERQFDDRSGGRDRRGRGRGAGGEVRVIHSDIRNEDIIYGTEANVLRAAEEGIARFSPDFILLSHAPSSTMISSDLETDAEKIAASSGLPVAVSPTDGEKDYVYGVSTTLEALGRLLIKPAKTVPGTLNILGCNSIDWTSEQYASLKALLTEAGWKICSCWGMKESTENLKKAASAEINLVVSEAGVRLAAYMESEFGIPSVFGAPFGKENTAALLRGLKGAPAEPTAEPSDRADVLIIAEQFTANALRTTLEARGYRNIRVLSFYDMAPAFLRPGDRKLTGEDNLAQEAAGAKLIIGNPDYQTAAASEAHWISLPDPGNFSPVRLVKDFDKTGEKLDLWLNSVLPKNVEQE